MYTDGFTIFNGQTHNMLVNGTNLLGNSSCTEAALITPKPGAPDHYFIFSNSTNNSNVGTIGYSEIDLDLGPDGEVIVKNQELYTANTGEGLDVLPHPDGVSFWVLAYDGAANMRSYRVDANGVSNNPVISDLGMNGTVLRGTINHTEDYELLTLSAYQGASGFIATADVDLATGVVSPAEIHVTGQVGFSTTFSPDGTKLYYSVGVEGWSGTPHQFDLETDTATQLNGTSGFAAAKLAPDGKVYFAGYGKTWMGVVNAPDEAGVAADFNTNGISMNGCISGYAVPNQTAAYLEFVPQ
jgi:hypothetical protein